MTSDYPRPPGYRRLGGGDFVDPVGRPVTDGDVVARLKSLAVPPAWRDVWIAVDPEAKVQAVGVDSAGRTQYRYAAWWTESRSRDKFAHVPGFAASLPSLREHVNGGLANHRRALDRDHVLSAAVRLLDLGFFRVGSERYARDNHTYGLTTLQRHHVHVSGETVTFDYSAKEHLHRVVEVDDPVLAPWARRLLKRGDDDPAFLAWSRDDGGWQRVHSSHVNAFIHTYTGIDATARRFRTWAGTVLAAAALGGARHDEKGKSPQLAAVRAASRLLGNTPAVARASYIHPAVLTSFDRGHTIAAAVRDAAGRVGDDRLAVLWRDPAVQAATLALLPRPE
ncbi:DNA topoisomerase IB [Actinoplanes sp. TRM 88003]|uniref:DNA topoisomerase n=1 Tax=Paractinoplanes aksuensis TaxID=2939490 RepID=A0ABT1DW41_9ACTN|nr:DNA topoisomerase IB [Actinoplanes aksuensis]MCO8275069.1 DNA topoisomerase IB [Actinoplanes aksuensis]